MKTMLDLMRKMCNNKCADQSKGGFCVLRHRIASFTKSNIVCAVRPISYPLALVSSEPLIGRTAFNGLVMGKESLLGKFSKALRERDGDRCGYCQRTMEDGAIWGKGDHRLAASVDHIIPQSRGGKDTLDNLVLCCRSCNSKKKTNDIFHLECGG